MLIHGSWLYFCGQLNSDILLYNSIIFRRDVLYYWEFRESVHEGDIGRTFKIMHVSQSAPLCMRQSDSGP
jgi:hypothetical protein